MREDIRDSLSGEPRNTYVNSLILVSRQIEYSIFFERVSAAKTLKQLKGLIFMLDSDSLKKLNWIVEEIKGYEKNANSLIKKRDEELYAEIMKYLHQTYLKEVRFAKPKHKGGTLTV
ncbi:MAG: hypothetical protein JSW14_01010 [Candidatus Bathyarchaeum sp.]|nr:MAG: hypothetical protein JSW14_01010 [Candidatus Bathyarchaeum sp.]